MFSKHFAMDTGSEAGMTGFLYLWNNFRGSILVFIFISNKFNKPE